MVCRVYVEKKQEFAREADALLRDLQQFLGIKGLRGLRVINRYDAEDIDPQLFEYCKRTVFSEPRLDRVFDSFEAEPGQQVFAVEYLPGQFDQRADSAAQCIQIISQGSRPVVRTAKLYVLDGELTDEDMLRIKKHIINPVEARQADLGLPQTLGISAQAPDGVRTLGGFTDLDDGGLDRLRAELGLAMDTDDIRFCRDYFRTEGRDPTITEIRMIDTYWSDHCRHTTFLTTIDGVNFEDPTLQSAFEEYLGARRQLGRTSPVNLMDIATVAAKLLKKRGLLDKLDESEEINACTVKIEVDTDGRREPWLLLFKNETHNHPTEIEPFGGAATCIGGAIRDPLSGRAYVYAAMRVTGAADPLRPVQDTLPGKLPQRKLVETAAAGYSSYGNQIGLATGQVDEIYHDGYAAKHMEIGAVIAAAPAQNVRRERPEPGDAVILLGGRTGRDGCGGATGSSKSHTLTSLQTCGAEVQKGNAPEERKLQRLFRNPEACRMIKRCNDFGAGGVSVAIGELADGLDIDLNAVPKKYDGLDGTELAISESQERMAVVVRQADAAAFLALAQQENLEATVVAHVKAEPRLTMRWNGKNIVDISRQFLSSNGAEKHVSIACGRPEPFAGTAAGLRAHASDLRGRMLALASDLNICSKRGLSERFDSTIGAGTVLMPFGGANQLTPTQAMVHEISSEKGRADTCSLMAWGYNPFISERSPYHGAYLAVVESVSKLIAAGAEFKDIYLTFQEYFPKPLRDGEKWDQPLGALLGAFKAQMDLQTASIGGKDSMSGSFEDLDVPPTLVSFAVCTADKGDIISPEFKAAGHTAVLLRPEYADDGLPEPESLKAVFAEVRRLIGAGECVSAYTLGYGGAAEGIMKMCFGNGVGFDIDASVSDEELFGYGYGSFILELAGAQTAGRPLGRTTCGGAIRRGAEAVDLAELLKSYEDRLEPVYSCNIAQPQADIPAFEYSARSTAAPAVRTAKPTFLIPVFPGTNCEYDTAKAIEEAGGAAQIEVIRNLSASDIAQSVQRFAQLARGAQAIFIPGGFSGGDEPDGSGKFITAFFRSGAVKEAVGDLLDGRGGLMCGICNGFQALIKLGLVPYGRITDADETSPTLTYNIIGRHQSRIVRTRVASGKSPWLRHTEPGQIYSVPISHGEGRFIADDELIRALAQNGQIATQYVDLQGRPTMDVRFNPNGSDFAIEGITSPDGRVFGKMGHSERAGRGLYKNVEGNYDIGMFRSAVEYFA